MPVETLISSMLLGIFGSPLNLGIIVFFVFIAIAGFLRIHSSAIFILFIPISFLVFEFIPQIRILAALVIGIIFALALIKITRG